MASLGTLPDEVLLKLAKYIEPGDITRVMRLNKKFHSVLAPKRQQLRRYTTSLDVANDTRTGEAIVTANIMESWLKTIVYSNRIEILVADFTKGLYKRIIKDDGLKFAQAIATRLGNPAIDVSAVDGLQPRKSKFTMQISDQKTAFRSVIQMLVEHLSINEMVIHKDTLDWEKEIFVDVVRQSKCEVETLTMYHFTEAKEVVKLAKMAAPKKLDLRKNGNSSALNTEFMDDVLQDTDYMNTHSTYPTTMDQVHQLIQNCFASTRTKLSYSFEVLETVSWDKELSEYRPCVEQKEEGKLKFSLQLSNEGRMLYVRVGERDRHRDDEPPKVACFELQDTAFSPPQTEIVVTDHSDTRARSDARARPHSRSWFPREEYERVQRSVEQANRMDENERRRLQLQSLNETIGQILQIKRPRQE